MGNTSLGDRMKEYESVSKIKLTNRTPVIIRLDGKAFHTWTKKLKSGLVEDDPFNETMNQMMAFTTQIIMRHMQNAVFAYTQSDEISILMNDWNKLTTDQWFGNNVQKMVSVSASAASAAFNHVAAQEGFVYGIEDVALFDSRAFNIPKEEVVNYFLWRQQDATRNSINMLGQHYFSHSQLHGKNVSQVQDMLMLDLEDKQVNWNDLDVWKKRGTCIHKNRVGQGVMSANYNIPIFSKDRNFIEQWLESDEDG